MTLRNEIPEEVMESAVEWFDGLRRRQATDNEEVADWLLRSPTHIEAFLSVATLHGGLSAMSAENREWLENLLAETSENVMPIDGSDENGDSEPGPAGTDPEEPRVLRPMRYFAVAATLALAFGYAMSVGLFQVADDSIRYVTEVGEQRAVVLEDGSVIQLNTDSMVEVSFGETSREIHLVHGEAIFDVRKDPARPFRVRSDGATVEAIGTRFNVYKKAEQTVVTVIEGRVAVAPATPAATSLMPASPSTEATAAMPVVRPNVVEVAVGEQLSVARDGAPADVPVPIDTTRATAWTQRRVVFDNDTLEFVIAEFNRYNRTKLVLQDARLRERRISGVFTVDDPEAFVAVLESMTSVRGVTRNGNAIEITSLQNDK